MSIDEFRRSKENVRIHLAPVKRVSYDIDRNRTVKSSSTEVKTDIASLKADCSATKVINNPLKIKKKMADSQIPTDSVLCMLHNIHDSVQ